MAEDVNAAVQANLDRVLADERVVTVRRIAWFRAFAGAVGTLVMLPRFSDPVTRPSLFGSMAFFSVAVVLLFILKKRPRAANVIAYATPLIDTPLLAFIQSTQQAKLPAAWMGLPTNVGLMMMLIATSALTLSRPAVVLTAMVAMISNQYEMGVAGLEMTPRFLVSIAPIVIAGVGISLMDRLRTMVHAARRRDLLGKYVLGNRLGAGGMAEVFEATYSPEGGFERRVAVKRIPPSIAENPESVALFRREAEVGARLAHPNIVQVLDFGADQDSYFIAMEYVEGTTLGRLLLYLRAHQQQLPVPVVVFLAQQLAEALAYVHDRSSPTGSQLGLVHRDLNPPNVMLSRTGEVKLGDFGIARIADQPGITRTGILRGKVGYSAPEQLLGEPYDARADLFSLGVTLYECLSAKKLFAGESDVSVLKACLEQPILPLPQVRPEVPAALDAIVRRLLERDLSRRTPSAMVLREELYALPAELRDAREAQRLLAELVGQVRAVSATAAQSPDSGQSATALADTTRTTETRLPV
jgi:serine/threonine protein kinase